MESVTLHPPLPDHIHDGLDAPLGLPLASGVHIVYKDCVIHWISCTCGECGPCVRYPVSPPAHLRKGDRVRGVIDPPFARVQIIMRAKHRAYWQPKPGRFT